MSKGYKDAVESGIPEHELKVVRQTITWFARQAGVSMHEIADAWPDLIPVAPDHMWPRNVLPSGP